MLTLPMLGGDLRTDGRFSYVSCEGRVPRDHPLRRILALVDRALAELSPEFAKLYAPIGRPSIPPEKLLRALLLQAFYSVRSERQLMEQWEKSQIQALERTQPLLPLSFGYVEGVTHDYLRHGTTTLFVALDLLGRWRARSLDGTVPAQCRPRHRHQEFLARRARP